MAPSTDTPEPTGMDRAAAEALIDEEAAEIDPRDPAAAEQIADLEAEADNLGLPTPDPDEVEVTPPDGA